MSGRPTSMDTVTVTDTVVLAVMSRMTVNLLSINQPTNQSVRRSINPTISQSVDQSINCDDCSAFRHTVFDLISEQSA